MSNLEKYIQNHQKEKAQRTWLKILRKIGVGIGSGYLLIGLIVNVIPGSCTLGNIFYYRYEVMSHFLTYKEWDEIHLRSCVYEAEDAANQGDVQKQLYLGKLYYTGHYGPYDGWEGKKNYTKSVEWYKLAAEQGSREAISKLVSIYSQLLIESDVFHKSYLDIRDEDEWSQWFSWDERYKEAAKWYKLAAEQGNSIAQADLGDAYYEGKGVPQNYKEAVKWWEKSGMRNYSLGKAYRDGKGVSQNHVMAHMYFNVGASDGSYFVNYEKARSNLEKEMTPLQIEEAQQLALELVQSHDKK
jgi:uncharacterized protein